MKVIKEGKKIGGVMRVTCKKCEAELEIEAGDLKEEHRDSLEYPIVFSYKCPCCQRTQYLGWEQLSEEISFDISNN